MFGAVWLANLLTSLSSWVSQAFVLSSQDDFPQFCRSLSPTHSHTDPLFPELIPGSYPPWEQRPGVTPVGAPGTTPLRPPLRPPGIPADPNEHRDIRDYNPPDPDIAKGKGKSKGKGKGKKGQGQGSGKGKGKPKGKKIVPVLVQIEVWHSHLICGLPFHFLGALGRMRSLCRLH